MATIKSALSLYDGMSGPLKNIHTALNIVLNSFEAVQDASGNVIDSSAIQEAREELARAGSQLDQMEQNIRDAERAQDQFNDRVRDGTNAADGLTNKFSKLKTIVATLGISAGIKKLGELSDQFTSTRARLNLIADDGGSVEAVQQKLNALNQDQTVDVAANIKNTVTTTGTEAVDQLANKLNDLNRNANVSVTTSDHGTVDEIGTRIDQLDQAVEIPVNVTNRNQPDTLGNAAEIAVTATDNGTIDDLGNRLDGLNQNVTVPVEVTDNNSVEILEAKIMASAQRSRASYFDTANAIASMGANARSAFSTNDELIAFMEQINKQFVIGGASAQGQAAAMLQLTQAMGAGALRGEELNSILENAPGIARAIEQYMGVAEGSIKKYAEEGLITAEIVKNAMFAAAEETNAKFDSMPMTWAQIWTSMQNRAILALQPILEKINAIANSARMQGIVDGAMDAFSTLIGVLGIILDLVIGVGSAIYDNWSWISPIIYGIAGAYLVLHGAMLAYNAVQAISNGLQAVSAARSAFRTRATLTEAAATTTATGAQVGLNAALYACPIMWIVMLVIALVAVFYAAVAAVNKFAGTSVSATGIICGAFMAALAFIGNLFVALWNIAVDVFVLIYNLVATVANFIGNVFNDPVGAVARLFFDLADTVLGVLQTLAGAIDAIFGSNLAGAVQGWRDSLGGWVDETFGKGEEVMEKMNADDMKLGRFEYGQAFDLGYKFGEGIEDTIGGLFKTPTLDEMGLDSLDAFNLGNTLDGVYGNTGDTAANTAAAADTLDYMDEDLAWMKDIAEREAINRYTTAEIKVEQHNENHISKDTDLDGVMEAFCFDFAEKLDVSAEGVHE